MEVGASPAWLPGSACSGRDCCGSGAATGFKFPATRLSTVPFPGSLETRRMPVYAVGPDGETAPLGWATAWSWMPPMLVGPG